MPTVVWADREAACKWATEFAQELKGPCVILLSGEMGAGKTQLVKWMLTALQVAEGVSPTFSIHQEYADGRFDHVDLYRLESDLDLENTGFWDLLQKPQAILFVEWADRLPSEVWPADWTKIYISIKKGLKEESRTLEWHSVKPQPN